MNREDFLEKMQNEQLEHQTQMRMANSANFTQHKYTKKDFDDIFSDLDKISLT